MNLSKNSWHYKFNKAVDWSGCGEFKYKTRFSLCGYFWLTMFNIFVKIPVMFIGGVLLLSVLSFAAHFVFYAPVVWAVSLFGVNLPVVFATFHESWVIGQFVMICLSGIGLYVIYKRNTHLFQSDKPSYKPNIFLEYLKAKKRKVCPIIEVVDNND